MGSIVEATLISLDGQVEDPMRFAARYFDTDAQTDALELLDAHDAMVLGRRTFEALGAAWASQSGAFADRINAIPKYVVSSTLSEVRWANSTIVAGDPVAAVTALKDQHERGLVTYGHGRLSRTLLDGGLIDSLRFSVHPVVVGGAPPPLQATARDFTLVGARTRSSGVVVLSYRTEG